MKNQKKPLLLLHLLLGLYSLSSVCSKLASGQPLGSPLFILLYGCVLFLLLLYAFGWQQIIKHLPLTTAYANKAVTVLWGIVYGMLFFEEMPTLRQLVAVGIIIAGILLYVRADGEEAK